MTTTTSAAVHTQRVVRLDIQALRALAVALVVIYHLWPGRLTGGFVGVDVFFVLSGFLISGLLVRELERTGRVSLGQFWARRVRRLLPASLLVLGVTVALVWAFLPSTQWENSARHVIASTLYVENWLLASQSVDYLAAEETPTAVQHYWSLSVEEQFYVVWPLLLVALAFVVRSHWRRWLPWFIGAVAAASLIASLAMTANEPQSAYFVTPTRAWEFALGALVAAVPALAWSARTRIGVAWLGIAMIVASAVALTAASAYPGWRALLPVVGTALVLLANAPRAAWSPLTLGALSPVQKLGDWSYSIYLWHWPLIVIVPVALGHRLGLLDKVLILAATVALAAATYRWVEQPGRQLPWLTSRRPAYSLVAAVIASALVVGGAWWLISSVRADQEREQVAQESPAPASDCFAAAELANGPGCVDAALDGVLRPTPLTAKEDGVKTCMQSQQNPDVRVCESGAPAETAAATVAVIGDSHASHWIPAVRVVADQNNWHLLEITKGSCPFTQASRGAEGNLSTSCDTWNDDVITYLEDRDDVTRIFTSGSSRNGLSDLNGVVSDDAGALGYLETWSMLPDSVQAVYALRDVPRPIPDVIDCIEALDSRDDQITPVDCALPRAEALLPDPLADAAATPGADPRVEFVDLSDLFCTETTCVPVVGHAMVYRDPHHLTETYSTSLGPFLAEVVARREG